MRPSSLAIILGGLGLFATIGYFITKTIVQDWNKTFNNNNREVGEALAKSDPAINIINSAV